MGWSICSNVNLFNFSIDTIAFVTVDVAARFNRPTGRSPRFSLRHCPAAAQMSVCFLVIVVAEALAARRGWWHAITARER